MALYFLKSVVWNSSGYHRPSGDKVHSGYPKTNGYGHEEWNNSELLQFTENGTKWKIFHTEGFGNQPLEANDGNVMVFLIASHESKQYLTAVAGNATSLVGEQHREYRTKLVQKLGIDAPFRRDAWSLPKVRRLFGDDEAAFNTHWESDLHWIPNWKCPLESYVYLHDPLELDPISISGKTSLTRMFGSYQVISRQTALHLLDLVEEQGLKANNLKDVCTDEADLSEDLEALEGGRPTIRAALVAARMGQGKFRTGLFSSWQGRCAVTGCGLGEVLRASHLKPWRDSTNSERLDPTNGLPLVAHLDALLDRGLISFTEDGHLMISNLLSREDRKTLRLGDGLRLAPSMKTRGYLKWHREHVFRGSEAT